jgi:hypothetical protein
LLDSNGDGLITANEKEQADILIYGHSWGASQTVTLALALGRRGVPVLLTIQVDSVRKPGQDDSVIPPNVKNAVNFYQTKGLIHGCPTIRAAEPERQEIVGNFQMSYRNRQINCDNYPWMARGHLLRPRREGQDEDVWLVRRLKAAYATVLDKVVHHSGWTMLASLAITVLALVLAFFCRNRLHA